MTTDASSTEVALVNRSCTHGERARGTVIGHPEADSDMLGNAGHPSSCPLEGCGGMRRIRPSPW